MNNDDDNASWPEGYVRVTNLRSSAAMDNGPQPGETIHRVDRANPVLGNRHILFNRHDAVQRRRVISAYRADLERDLAAGGPMSREIGRLAERVMQGEQICLACWCAPSPCHGDLIADEVRKQVERLSLIRRESPHSSSGCAATSDRSRARSAGRATARRRSSAWRRCTGALRASAPTGCTS